MNAPVSLPEARDQARKVLEEMIRRMGFEATVDAREQGDNEVLLQVSSPDASRLIGREAQMLNALQYLVNRILRAQTDSDVYCIVDVELYRERRRDRLLQEAYEAADRVRRGGRPYVFPPLGAADRRTIHQALRDDQDLETESGEEDEDGRKRVYVRLRKGNAPADAPPAAEGPAMDPGSAGPAEAPDAPALEPTADATGAAPEEPPPP